MNKIKDTSPDKVHGKLVRYRRGDCVSVNYGDKYLAVLISKKFNKFYDLTLLQYYDSNKPNVDDFLKGKCFGTRFGTWDELEYAVHVRMIECNYFDNNSEIEKVGSVNLISSVTPDGYAYLENTDELVEYYLKQLPIRIEKSKNAEKFPDLAFASEHLIDMKNIIE